MKEKQKEANHEFHFTSFSLYLLKNEFGSCFLQWKTNYMKLLTSNPAFIVLFISNSINHRLFIFWSIYYTKAKDRIKLKTNLKTEPWTRTST